MRCEHSSTLHGKVRCRESQRETERDTVTLWCLPCLLCLFPVELTPFSPLFHRPWLQCVDKVVCVMNLKGLSYRVDTEALRAFRINLQVPSASYLPHIPYLIKRLHPFLMSLVAQIDTDFYPERLKYLYMINAPCE